MENKSAHNFCFHTYAQKSRIIEISTWSTPHQDNHLPTWNKTMPAHTDQDCHIYADPIIPSQHNQITTLLRFDPKSQYEDPLAF